MSRLGPLPERMDFPGEEEKVLALWKELDAFKMQLKHTEGLPKYNFYDGPPFATGLPHYGHILAGTIKDVVTRYASQTGHHVERRFGWDTHGLPVEFEIDKKFDIKGRDDVMAMGIDKYNEECRSIVTRYTKEWERVVTRLGRWIDFENDYKTMEPWYMESVWWVFKTLFDKGLVYRGFKVMPYSTGCTTPLSNFEANLNYKEDTKDPAVVVSFPVIGEENTSFVAWTTTPWTLPSNLALCVHPEFTYVKVLDKTKNTHFILAKALLATLYPKMAKKGYKEGSEFEVVAEFVGAELGGKRYEPLFPYFVERMEGRAHVVLMDTYVTEDAGTGIVHQAPAFGEDDYRVCSGAGVIQQGGYLPCPVDDDGRFTADVADFAGQYVKDADDKICAHLKAAGKLVKKDSLVHSYPFCWRSDTPLIYRAVPSWFVAVTEIKEQLVANNDETYWVPASVKEKRFHNWLRDARDWAVSRNRYWGTPLPIWTNGDEIRVIGSVAELEEATGTKVTDLHRHFIDHLEIPSSKGGPPLKRVPEVFDCWFESGSMPYAQQHYPFERKEEFERDLFPAAFVAEGLDQTRGWFYTLMVLSTALFGKPAFQNLIVNGLVLASDGKKMSKRLRNYPDPTLVVHKYGADALRLYLINSPVVRAESLRFREEGVNGVVRDVFLPWFNAFRFFMQNVERFTASGGVFSPDAERTRGDGNEMDRWILAAEHNLIKFVEGEMSAYRLYTVIPRLVDFIEQLTNWYIRLNRRRMKGGDDAADTAMALMTTYEVLMNLCRLMAPFTPFFTEYMYQHLRTLHPASRDPAAHPTDVGAADSVHYLRMPAYDAERIDEAIEARVATMQQVVELGRVARERRGVSLRTPVRSITVVHKDGGVLEDALALKRYVLEEMNALEVHVTSDQSTWCKLTATPDFKLLGQRLGKDAKKVIPALKAMSPEDLATLQSTGSVSVGGVTVSSEEVKVVAEFAGDKSKYEGAASADGRMVVVVDIQMDEELELMGIARECVSRVQAARKAAGLRIGEPVHVYYSVAPAGERTPPPASPDVSGPVSKLGLGPYRKPLVDLDAPKEGGGGGGDGSGKQGGKKGGDAKKGGKQGGDAQKGGKKGGDAKKGGKKGGDAKKGGKQGGDAKKGGMKGPAVSADALMNRIHKALASQHSSVVETLGVPMVPDHPALRPPMATVVGVDEGEVAGVKFAVILTLPSPALGDDATVAAAAAATPPSTPAWRQAVYQTLGYCADAALASGMNATVDGVAVALKPGQHFWFRPDEALRACPALTAQLAADGLGDAMKPYQA